MDINVKLDRITQLLEQIVEKQAEHDERFDEQAEAIANVSTPGGRFSVFDPEE
jgi:hypothetical protein